MQSHAVVVEEEEAEEEQSMNKVQELLAKLNQKPEAITYEGPIKTDPNRNRPNQASSNICVMLLTGHNHNCVVQLTHQISC